MAEDDADSQVTPWRELYPAHPAAAVFPMLSDDELSDLAMDIKANGLLQPIIVQDGVLIDGRNRLAACLVADVEPRTEELAAGIDPVAYILATNVNRRHLSKGQRAMAVAKLYPVPTDKGGRGKTSKLNVEVSSQYVLQARTVLRWLPEIADLVMAGSKSLNDAYQDAQRLKEQADAEPKRLERLRERASNFADLVDEGRMTLVEAESAYATRLGEQRRERQAVLDVLDGLERHLDFFADGRRGHIVDVLREVPDDQKRLRALLKTWTNNLTETEALL